MDQHLYLPVQSTYIQSSVPFASYGQLFIKNAGMFGDCTARQICRIIYKSIAPYHSQAQLLFPCLCSLSRLYSVFAEDYGMEGSRFYFVNFSPYILGVQ